MIPALQSSWQYGASALSSSGCPEPGSTSSHPYSHPAPQSASLAHQPALPAHLHDPAWPAYLFDPDPYPHSEVRSSIALVFRLSRTVLRNMLVNNAFQHDPWVSLHFL